MASPPEKKAKTPSPFYLLLKPLVIVCYFCQKKAMIQRIQTLYLLLAVLFNALLFILPFSAFSKGQVQEPLYIYSGSVTGFDSPVPGTILIGITILTNLLVLSSIFLFRNRKLQANAVLFLLFPQLVLAGLLVYIQNFSLVPPGTLVHFKPGLFFPFISFTLAFLAFRRIKADEALVRSIDRIR
jgi:hypothetical protein